MGFLDKATSFLGVSPLGLGVSVAGQIFGAIKGGQANREMQTNLNRQQQENKAMYDQNANRSFLETNVAKDVVKEQKEALEDNRKNIVGRAAITGASDEATVAANTAANRTYAQGLSKLAGMGTQHRMGEERMYRFTKQGLDNQQMALNAQKADQASNLAGNAGNLLGSAVWDIKKDDGDNAGA